jgi:type I restriction enzyme S subunit
MVRLGDVCTLRNGRAYKKPELLSEGKYPVLRVGNFFTSEKWYYSDLELDDTKYCDNGDLLYAWSASFGARIWEGQKVIYHYHIWRVDVDKELIDRKFFYYWFEFDKEQIKKKSGAGATMIHVSKGSMEKREFSLPPLKEQQEIVEVLSDCDRAIEKLEKRLGLFKKQKQGLMQRLFSQAFRFTRPDGSSFPDWEEKRLGEAFSERNERGHTELPLFAVTISKGIILTDSLNRKKTASIEKDAYKRICEGDIAYNTMRMWQGASGVSNDEGIVSPAYTVAIPNPNQISAFFGQYFKHQPIIKIFERYSQGLTSDTWSLKFPAFSTITLPLPHPDEQAKIVDCLGTIDHSIDLLNQRITATKVFKKALLQQLLTGKLRIKEDS